MLHASSKAVLTGWLCCSDWTALLFCLQGDEINDACSKSVIDLLYIRPTRRWGHLRNCLNFSPNSH